MTYAEFVSAIKAQLFPDGEAESLITIHSNSILAGIIDLQRYCRCLQENHEDIIPQCSTYFRNGLTVIDTPAGRVKRLSVLVGTDWDTRIKYTHKSFREVLEFAREFQDDAGEGLPANTDLPVLQLGFKYPEATTDSTNGRAITGYWCIENDRIYVAPWIQSTEYILLEWDGIKTTFAAADVVDFDATVQRAVEYFVRKERIQDFAEGKEMAKIWTAAWMEARADVINDCEERRTASREERADEDIERVLGVTDTTIPTGTVVEEEDTTDLDEGGNVVKFAVVGDPHYEDSTEEANTAAVAALVRSQELHFVCIAGDMVTSGTNFDSIFGKYYGAYICPYKGNTQTYGEADENRLWPVIGNHDISAGNDFTSYNDFFGPPITDRYYDIIKGSCHIFFLAGDANEEDSSSIGGTQYSWFIDRLRSSTAPWKIVIVHEPPYSSGGTHGSTTRLSEWDFGGLGVDLVISGHDHLYERIVLDRTFENESPYGLVNPGTTITYIVNGLGGADFHSFSAAVEGSTIQYNTTHGALFIEASCTELVAEFIDVSETVIDSFTLTKTP